VFYCTFLCFIYLAKNQSLLKTEVFYWPLLY